LGLGGLSRHLGLLSLTWGGAFDANSPGGRTLPGEPLPTPLLNPL